MSQADRLRPSFIPIECGNFRGRWMASASADPRRWPKPAFQRIGFYAGAIVATSSRVLLGGNAALPAHTLAVR